MLHQCQYVATKKKQKNKKTKNTVCIILLEARFILKFPLHVNFQRSLTEKWPTILHISIGLVGVSNRPCALRGHVTWFLWKWKLYDFAFKKQLVGHILNKIIVIWFVKPASFLKMSKFVAGHVIKMWFLKLGITSFWTQILHFKFKGNVEKIMW